MQESLSTTQQTLKTLDTASQAAEAIKDLIVSRKKEDLKSSSVSQTKRLYGSWYELSYSGFGLHWREGLEFERFLILFATWQSGAKDSRPTIKNLIEEIAETWQLTDLEYIDEKFFSAASLRFRPSFFTQTLENSREHPDYDLPSLIRQAANDYELTTNKIGKPAWSLKRACLQFIAVIANRIYSSGFEKLEQRQDALIKLQGFIASLLRGTKEFPALNTGINFRSQLDLCLTKIESAIEKITKILTKKPVIEKWLEHYYKHAKTLLNFLPRYIHYSIQTCTIPQDFDSHLQEIFRNYQAIVEAELSIKIRPARVKAIFKLLNKGRINFSSTTSSTYSVEQLSTMVSQGDIDAATAGFYLDYVAKNPSQYARFKHALATGEAYELTADQFLRELIYDPTTDFIKNQKLINTSLQLYRSTKEDAKEYALIFLRQHVLKIDSLLDLVAHHQREKNHELADYFFDLAKNLFNPIMVKALQNVDKSFEAWKPGIFDEFRQAKKGVIFDRKCRTYYEKIIQLIHISYRLGYYSWVIREVEWATVSDGNSIIAAANGQVLEIISHNTLHHILSTIAGILTNLLKLKEQISKTIDLHPSTPTSHWLYNQSNIRHNSVYQGVLKALEDLSFYCHKETIGSYTSGIAIESQLTAARDSAKILQDIYSILPGVTVEELQSMEAGRELREDIWQCIRRFQQQKESKKSQPPSAVSTPLKSRTGFTEIYEAKEGREDVVLPIDREGLNEPLRQSPRSFFEHELASTTSFHMPAAASIDFSHRPEKNSLMNDSSILLQINTLLTTSSNNDFFKTFIQFKKFMPTFLSDYHKLLAITLLINFTLDKGKEYVDHRAKLSAETHLQREFFQTLNSVIHFSYQELSQLLFFTFDKFERLKNGFETTQKVLHSCLMKQDPSFLPALLLNLQSLCRELKKIKLLYISEKINLEERNHIRSLCDNYLISIRPEFISETYKLSAISIEQLKNRILSGDRIEAKEIPIIYKLFKSNHCVAYKIIAKLCLLQQIESAFPLQQERAFIIHQFISILMKKIDGSWAGKKRTAMQEIIFRRLYNIFFIATADCLLDAENRRFLKKLIGSLLNEFGIPVVFIQETNKFSRNEPHIPAKINNDAVDYLLSAIENLSTLDALIFKISLSKDQEETRTNYELFKLEYQMIIDLDKSPRLEPF